MVGTRDKLKKEKTKLSELAKEIWSNIDDKELFPVSADVSNYGRSTSSLDNSWNEYVIGVRNYGAAISILLFIEQKAEIIVSHRSQSNKWEGTFF